MYRKCFISLTVFILVIAGILTGRAEAQLRPSSAVLLPYFEVDLGGSGKTTMFAVGNALNQPVDIQIEVRTNWGIPVFNLLDTLKAHEVKSFNLRDWVVQGQVPNRALLQTETAQMKAVLSGRRSPQDNLFYSTPAAVPDLAVGSVVIRTRGVQAPGALWGDFVLIDPVLNVSMGDDLVNIDRTTSCPGTGLCSRHALRFIAAEELKADTEVVIWTDRAVAPSANPYPENKKIALDGSAYSESGQLMSDVHLRLLPLQVVSVGSLGLKDPFGWLDVKSGEPTFIGIHYDSSLRDGAALQAYCLNELPPPPADRPRIELEKLTNGEDADDAPGPTVAVGSPILWEYVVSNTGSVRLNKIDVTDDRGVQVTCPKAALNPAESMTCTGRGTAVACQYENIGTVTAKTPSGDDVTADDPSHYFGGQNAKIDVETAVNGNDADTAPGPTIPVGAAVKWTYVVTNNGGVNLAEIKVTDGTGAAVSCPKTSLRPGEAMTCSVNTIATAGQHDAVASASAKPPCGPAAKDSDPAHYFGKENQPPGLKIEKRTNGQRYTQAPGASLAVGSPVTWSYLVTNTGSVTLTNVKVTDDKVASVACPKTTLQAGESMTCTASGTAVACQYSNTGTAVGTPPTGPNLTVQDWSFYFGQAHPAVHIEKSTNGQDADAAPGPTIAVGSPVNWTYVVSNTGDVALTNVAVTDSKGVAVSCPKATLQAGESMTCTGNGTATAGQYENIGSVTAKPPCGAAVSDTDPSHYYGLSQDARIDIEKATNGQDADAAPGPTIPAGDPVHWTYVVTNTGQVALSNVKVTDNKGVAVSCPKTVLQPLESMTCTGNGTATAGQYENIGSVVGTPASGTNVTDSDPSHYFGQTPPPPPAGQGCTPGYWKNHTDSWPPTGYSPSQTVKSVFGQASLYPSLGSDSLLGALSFQGGSTLEGAAGNLLRAGVAGLLDAAHPNVNYPRMPASVISSVNSALASGNRDTMLSLASAIDADNNLGCPLN